MSLKDRCLKFVHDINYQATLGAQPAPVEDLVDFVQSEIGRAADYTLADSAPLVLYFADDNARRDFVEAIMEAKPGMISRRWPR